MMRKIKQINFNWTHADGYLDGAFSNYTVGSNNVVEIQEHQAAGEGDRWYYDVHFMDGTMERIFNPNKVFYEKWS